MINDITLKLDTSHWPESATLTEWSRIIPKRYSTLLKYRREGRLPGVRQLDYSLRVSKATMMACFGISKPTNKKSNENGARRKAKRPVDIVKGGSLVPK